MARLDIELSESIASGAAGMPAGALELLERVARAACEVEGIDRVSVCLRIADEEEMRALNRAMRGIDRATDVLSFPAFSFRRGTARDGRERLSRQRDPETGLAHLGDIAISLPRALSQGEEYGHGPTRELAFLLAHAMLHLMGYDHEREEDRRRMRALEERVMDAVGTGRAQGGDHDDGPGTV